MVDAHLSASGYERHFEWRGLQLAVERGPLVRASKLTEVFSRFTKLAAAAEQTARQQTAQIEAENDLGVAKGHAKTLKGQLFRAEEVKAATAHQLEQVQTEGAALAARLTAEVAATERRLAQARTEKHAAERAVNELTRERDTAVGQIQQGTVAKEAYLTSFADLQHRLSKASVERARLEAEVRQAAATNQAHLASIADLQRRLVAIRELEAELLAAREKNAALVADNAVLRRAAGRLSADAAELSRQLAELSADNERLAAENRRRRAQARGDARAAARLRAENVALRTESARLAADEQALSAEVRDLRVIEWRLRSEIRRWRAQARGEPRTAARDRAENAGLVAARWARSRLEA